MRIRSSIAFALVAILTLVSARSWAYTGNTTAAGMQLRWSNGSVIRYQFNQNFSPGTPPDLVRAAIHDAFRTLEAALPPQAGIRFEEAGSTAVNRSGADGVNLITFTSTDPADQLSPGTVAAARAFFDTTTGQIAQMDLVFNSRVVFTTALQAADTFDIESVALHEGAHALGVGHSGINSAILSPFGGQGGGFPVRRLHTDDAAGLRTIYGQPGATISGRITTAAAGVKGAHVVATEAATGVTAVSALSNEAGNYAISGLSPGSYRVFVEPLDGPITLADIAHALFTTGNTDFVTTFLTNPVSVTSGEVGGVNIQVAAPRAMNLQELGLLVGTSFFRAGSPVSVRRGTDNSILVGGSSLSGQVSFSSPRITFLRLRTLTDASGVARQFADVTVAANAAPGPTDVYFGSASFTGGVVVTVNPQVPSNGIVDAAASNQGTSPPHYAPGGYISIFGADIAEQLAVADRTPLPTQMGGVSVRVGNRLAPLLFVSPSPGQINALIPLEVTGTSVDVSVLAGAQSESARVTLALGSAAPRIFGFPALPQGAITIANTFILAAPAGRVVIQGQSSRPAIRGQDFLSIFCTGLGRVTSPPPGGAAALANPLSTTVEPVSVTIGGVAATPIFSGLTPGLVGLYQINVQVPATAPTGDAVPVVVRVGAASSNTATMAVQ